MLSKKAFERGVDFEKQAIGTGPFKIAEWDRRTGVTFAKNPAYWAPGRPYMDGIKIFYNVETSATVAAFSAGRNDVMKVADKPQADAVLAANPQARVDSYAQDTADNLRFRVARPPFNDVRVRRAVHLAIDRQEMINTLTAGLGHVNPPSMQSTRKDGWGIPEEELLKLPGYRQPKDADIAEAKRLLAEAGHPTGLEARVAYGSTNSRLPAELEIAATQLAKVGIRLKLEGRDEATSLKQEQDGDWDIATNAGSVDSRPEKDWSGKLHSKGRLNPGVDINDPELDRIIDAQNVELDVEKRKQLWISLQRLMLDKLYVAPLITQVGYAIYQPYVTG